MDDVGQTLLNWASAFGTQEMVGFVPDTALKIRKSLPFIQSDLCQERMYLYLTPKTQISCTINEPHREKTGFLPRRKQRRRSASR